VSPDENRIPTRAGFSSTGHAESLHSLRVDDNCILFYETADARDFGDAFRFGEAETQLPVLDRTQIRKVVPFRGQRIEWQDTVLLGPREWAEIALVADNPGDWMFHCHIWNARKAA